MSYFSINHITIDRYITLIHEERAHGLLRLSSFATADKLVLGSGFTDQGSNG